MNDTLAPWTRTLLTGIVLAAIRTLDAATVPNAPRNLLADGKRAADWMLNPADDSALDYLSICRALDLDPRRLTPRAKGLRRFVDQKLQAARPYYAPMAQEPSQAPGVAVKEPEGEPMTPKPARGPHSVTERTARRRLQAVATFGARAGEIVGFDMGSFCASMTLDPAGDLRQQAREALSREW